MYPPFVLDAATFEPPDDLDLVIFPDYVEGDIGIYRADLIPIKKQLAEIGVRADFAFPPDRRTWLRELSAEQLLLNIAIGLGTSGTVAMVQHLLTRQKDPGKVRVKITKARKVRGRRMWDAEFVEFEGSRDDVSAQLDQWKHLNGDE